MTAPAARSTVKDDRPTPADRRDVPMYARPRGAPDTDVDAARMNQYWVHAVWTADSSATVELSRLAGPRSGTLQLPDRLAHQACAARACDLDRVECKLALYERCLAVGTQYDIYRWVNLEDLVDLWPLLALPVGLKAEWTGALRSSRAGRS